MTASPVAAAPGTGPAWSILQPGRGYAGFAYGHRYPVLAVALQGQAIGAPLRKALWQLLVKAAPGLAAQEEGGGAGGEVEGTLDWPQAVAWLLTLWQQLQEAQGLAVFETGKAAALPGGGVRCLVPVAPGGHRQMAQIVAAFVDWLRDAGDAAGIAGDDPAPARSASLVEAVAGLAVLAPVASNAPRFGRAAYQLGMPTLALPGGVTQFGLGSTGRRLDSSFTDVTSVIATKLARNKLWASALLAQAGLPVPAHVLVADADGAATAARQLGYPVVVKPADLDGGVGVAAGLESEADVRQAFVAAREVSQQVLVERHVQGRDYRLTVFQDEVIWAIERVPAAVEGNGVLTVTQLVAQVNADPRRGTGQHAPLKKLILDAEAEALLERQGLSVDAVPANGQLVRLRRAANVASGGRPVAVHDQVHPDNAALAVRAAQALGLDLAGIDLLIEDISRSWREGAGNVAICEVNAQPNLGQTTAAHLYAQILQRMVPAGGRVPIFLVLGGDQPEAWLAALSEVLTGQGLRVGVAGPHGVSIGSVSVADQPLRLHEAGRMLALNRQVDAMVIAITEDSVLTTGLPWPHYDVLVLARANLPAGPRLAGLAPDDILREWFQALLPACDGLVTASSAAGLRVTGLEDISPATWLEVNGSELAVARQIVLRDEYLARWK